MQQSHQIIITSLNIENIKANHVVINDINKNYKTIDVLIIQEHWLHCFEKDLMTKNLSEYEHFTRCYDDNDNSTQLYTIRGHGGISILWRKELTPYMKQLKDDGNTRIQAVLIKNVLLINCYLPSGASKPAVEAFISDIATLEIIIRKYPECDIVIGGDLNCDIFNRKTVKEKTLLQMINNFNLKVANESFKDDYTFQSKVDGTESHLDYFIYNRQRANKFNG